jgi:glutamyl-Q tRNA(Asp) synthetase
MGLLYPCFCSRAEVAAHADGTDPDGAPRYGGTCRGLPPEAGAERLERGERAAFRLRMDTALSRVGSLEIRERSLVGHELQPGAENLREAHPEDWGDAVIVRKDTPTSYHLSVVVDDAAQEVTHVTRGMDLYRATDLHVLLQKLLGLPSPIYAHHALITDDGDRKLAKSRGSTSLRDLRASGWSAADVRRAVGFD